MELGDALAHRLHHAPAAGHRAAGHGERTTNDNPVRDPVVRNGAAGDECGGDDAHAFLRVVGAVAETEAGGGNELEPAKPAVNAIRRLAAHNPARDSGHPDTHDESD